MRWWLILIVSATLMAQVSKEPCAVGNPGGSHAVLPCRASHHETARVARSVQVCGQCHAKQLTAFSASQHGRTKEDGPTCVICHGTDALKTASQIERQCLSCHPAPPLFFMNPVPAFAGKVSCMNCHSAHSD